MSGHKSSAFHCDRWIVCGALECCGCRRAAIGSGNVKSQRLPLKIGGLTVLAVLATVVAYKMLAPLPAPIPVHGVVLDADTGQPIVGARLETRWRLYDYPMIDGAGSYEVSSVTVTDSRGYFSLVFPKHRRGIWNTDIFPPEIAADGYIRTDGDDEHAVEDFFGDFVIIRLTPLMRAMR